MTVLQAECYADWDEQGKYPKIEENPPLHKGKYGSRCPEHNLPQSTLESVKKGRPHSSSISPKERPSLQRRWYLPGRVPDFSTGDGGLRNTLATAETWNPYAVPQQGG